jgi:hypothetical protein
MRPKGQNSDRRNSAPSKPVTPTTSQILADGTKLEFVRVKGESKLLVWRNGRARVAGRFEFDNRIYEPLSLDPTVLVPVGFDRKGRDANQKNEPERVHEVHEIRCWSGPLILMTRGTAGACGGSQEDRHRRSPGKKGLYRRIPREISFRAICLRGIDGGRLAGYDPAQADVLRRERGSSTNQDPRTGHHPYLDSGTNTSCEHAQSAPYSTPEVEGL